LALDEALGLLAKIVTKMVDVFDLDEEPGKDERVDASPGPGTAARTQ
jgi:hypothetical protein